MPRRSSGGYGAHAYSGYLAVCRVLLDTGGYVRKGQPLPHGMYFGAPNNLYNVASEDSDVEINVNVRAPNRNVALVKARELYPKAKFFRRQGRR